MEINGLPLHPLVVHAVVIGVPVTALLALAYVAREHWRAWARTPLLVIGLLSAGATQLAAMSGDDLKQKLGLHSQLLEQHEMWAGRLQAGMWIFAAVIVAAWFAHAQRRTTGGILLRVLLAIGALAVGFLAFKTGDAGARAVWAQ